MKTFNKIALAVAVSLGLAVTAYAQPGRMGGGMGPCAQQGDQQVQGCTGMGPGQGRLQTMQGGMGMGRMQAMNYGGKQGVGAGNCAGPNENCVGPQNRGARPQTGQSLMTPEERTAMRDKMQNAKTPEERQQIAAANHAEMQKRAAEKGITLPEQRGPHGRGFGPNAAPQSTETR
jgi:hypothetical protein